MEADTLEVTYPLSPMQKRMLFHGLASPRSGAYVRQLECFLPEDLDVPAFERAWQRVLDFHAELRASFHWEEPGEPFQNVHRHVVLPLRQEDWRGRSAAEQQALLQGSLRGEQRGRFGASRAAPLRVVLLPCGAAG